MAMAPSAPSATPTPPATSASLRAGARTPRPVTVSAWAAPVMVVGGFALIAVVPVTVALVGSLLRVRDRAVRLAAAVLAAAYAIPLVVWLTRPDAAPSLSKDIHPAFVGVIVAVAAALVVAIHRPRRR